MRSKACRFQQIFNNRNTELLLLFSIIPPWDNLVFSRHVSVVRGSRKYHPACSWQGPILVDARRHLATSFQVGMSNAGLQPQTKYFQQEKSRKIGQERKILMAASAQFFTALQKSNFWMKDWALGSICTDFHFFLNISLFFKILSLKSFSNS